MEKMSERKKSAEVNIATLERNLNMTQEETIKLKSLLDLSGREKKLLEKNMVKVNGKNKNNLIISFFLNWF